ncbi:MAG: S46 family peptidase, partial [Gemmatimonadetes bacterium]|nr:S46 family peptidase [Gemmatimonadota bacterium]
MFFVLGCGPSASPPGTGPQPSPPPAIPADGVQPVIPEPPPQPAPPLREVPELTVPAGRFDNGKMWTFEYPPLDYFREEYNFEPDEAWFEHARLGALRLSNCTASFVSPSGLVMTNHHCARESVVAVSQEGEELLDNGFYAPSLAEERHVEDFYADQLIDITDVSAEVDAALAAAFSDDARAAARESVSEEITTRITEEWGGEEAGIEVEVISLWNGAKTSAYVFKRYSNIKLVMAPELQMGFFGGDPDNFTYPRYALDVSFFRVYDENDQPLRPDHYFKWSEKGVEEGDAVFIIGNPGSTSRLQTVSQLGFRGAVGDKAILELYGSRAAALQAFYDDDPEAGDAIDLRNTIFSLLNAEKAYGGIVKGLQDPMMIARRRDSERKFRAAIESNPGMQQQYGDLFDRMADLQEQKLELADEYGAFLALGSPNFTSSILLRGLFGFQYVQGSAGGAPPAALAGIEERFSGVAEQPRGMQVNLLAARLTDMQRHLGDDDQAVSGILRGRSPKEAAEAIVSQSALADSASAIQALHTLTMTDPTVQLVAAFLPRFGAYQGRFGGLVGQEGELASSLGRARFSVDGTSIPPDATFSLRIADGVVKSYEYNGTRAPVYTTFYGLYDHYHSYGADTEWALPDRWLNPPATFDLSTPMNFVSTVDIIGGNSGSPVLNTDLE